MKQNDYFALNINLQNSGINPDDLRAYGITPDNTGLEEKDYYRKIPQVVETFTKNGEFDEAAFSSFYDSVRRAYSTYASDYYMDNLINAIPTSSTDIFSLGNTNIADDSAYITRTKDPNRHQMGIGNLFQTGKAAFSEREVAQANKVLDENGNQLDWSPNDRGGLKALFRPALALAEWKEGETSIENGVEVVHHAGERKYDENGDPMYQILGTDEIYGRDVLHFFDTLTREGTFWNKIDVFDSDGVDTNIAKTVSRAAIEIAAYMSPAGPYLGALEAAKQIAQTLPVLTKAINGVFTNDNNDNLGKKMTSIENWAAQFSRSTSDQGTASFWTFENIANQLIDSTKQLYSQSLIQKIPYLLNAHPSIESQKLGQFAATLYMATTAADEVYGEYKKAGVNDRYAGIGSLATMAAFFGFMNHEYFKTYLFSDPTLELPELRKALKTKAKMMAKGYRERIETNTGAKIAEGTSKLGISEGTKWYNKAYNGVTSVLKKIPEFVTDNTYLSRAFNEGLEEVMEEGATDLIKGLSLGLDELGFNIKENTADDVDFGYSMEDFLQRYATAFVGGAFGGAVFEGLTQWNNRKVKGISKLDIDEQLAWYIRNGYENEINQWIDRWERKGKFGSKNLSMQYTVEVDGDKKKVVWNPSSDKQIDQNKGIANLLRQEVATVKSDLKALGPLMFVSDNDILKKAMGDIKKEAEAANMTEEDYSAERLRDARIDFIKQTGIHRLILTDAADLQEQIFDLDRRIKNREAELSTNTDANKASDEEKIKNDEALKTYRKDLETAKKALEDLLSGKRADEYLALSLFVGDKNLKDIYLSDSTDENGKPTYFENIDGWVRARYGQSYTEMLRNAGEKNEESGMSDLEEYLQSGFNTWKTASENVLRWRGAYDIHKALSKIIDPVIQSQISDYTGYKSEFGRSKGILYGNFDPVTLDQVFAAKAKLQAFEEANPDFDPDDEEFVKLATDYNNAIRGLYLSSPQRILDNPFNEENPDLEVPESEETKAILQNIKKYYQTLNDKKIVSEFSDDILETTLWQIIRDRITTTQDENGNTIDPIASWALQNAFALNDIDDILTILKINAQESGDDELSDAIEDITDFRERITQKGTILDAGSSLFEYVSSFDIVKSLLTPEQNQELEQKDKLAHFYDGVLGISKNFENVYDGFLKGSLKGLNAYKSFKDSITSISGSELIPDIDLLLDHLLFDSSDFIKTVNEIKQLQAEGVKTPIMDWISAFNTTIAGTNYPLWELLQREMKNLASKEDLNEYVIDNPDAVKELEFLKHALRAAHAVLEGAKPYGANRYINELKTEDKLPVITLPELMDVYDHDLNVISARIAALLDLHYKNHKSTIATKRETWIKNSPKFLQKIVEQVTGEPTELQKRFTDILDIDLTQIWNDINQDRFDFDTITEANFDEFWKAFRQWMDAIYDAVSKVDLEKAFEKASKQSGRNIDSKEDLIGYILTSSFTDLWKFKNSEINEKEDTKVSDFDVVVVLGAIIGNDPKDTFGKIQYVSEKIGRKPFWDQALSIIVGYSQIKSRNLFNSIVDNIVIAGRVAIESNPELAAKESEKQYLLNRSVIHNAVFIDGASGTGKSNIVLKFIKEMSDLIAIKKSDDTTTKPRSLALAKYKTRSTALGKILDLTGDNCMTISEFVEKYFRPLTHDDYETEGSNGRLYYKMKPEVLDELRKKLISEHNLIEDKDMLNIFVDEIGLVSEADLQLLTTFSEAGYINLIFAGDRMQRGFTTKIGEHTINSGITDVQMISTPRLTTSMRSNYFGMQHNLEVMEARLKILWDKWQETPWISSLDLKLDTTDGFKPIFIQNKDGIYGIGIVADGDTGIETLQKFNGTIAIVTDHPEDYTKYASSNVVVTDADNVQGDEYDYVLVDIKKIPEMSQFDTLRYEYTVLSRAKNGTLVVNSFNSVSSYTTRADAATEIVTRDEKGEISGKDIDQYKTWWDKLFSNDIYNGGPVTVTEKKPEPGTSAKPTIAPSGPTNPTGGDDSKASTVFEYEGFNEEKFKADVIEHGEDVKIPFYTKTAQRRSDLRHYKEYHDKMRESGNRGILLDTKSFIDWLFDENSNAIELLNGSYGILRGISMNNNRLEDVREFIRNFAVDFLSLSENDLKEKYADSGAYDDIINDTNWKQFTKALCNSVAKNGNKLVYIVNEGNIRYFYYIATDVNATTGEVKHYAVPIAISNSSAATGLKQGWVNLSVKQETPLIMLSTAGAKTKTIQEAVGHYAEVSDRGYIVKATTEDNPGLVLDDGERGKAVRRFIINNRGQAHVIISSIFNHGPAKPGALLVRHINPNTNKVDHLDQTELDSNARLMAVNRRFTLKQYHEYATILRKLWDRGLRNASEDELNKLREYVADTITSAAALSDDDSERIKNFRKMQLIGNGARENLITALIRWYWNDGKPNDRRGSQQFIEAFSEWFADTSDAPNKNGFITQKGISFTIYNSLGLADKYYIMSTGAQGTYEVVRANSDNTETKIGKFKADQWFNLGNFDVFSAAKTVIAAINGSTVIDDNYQLTDDQIKQAINNGNISIGFATKYVAPDGDKRGVRFFPPFDSDVVKLIIHPDDDGLDKFLMADPQFKYGFLVGYAGNNDTFANDDWMETGELKQGSTDISEVIPPLYSIESEGDVDDTYLPNLNILDHKSETGNKADITVRVEFDNDKTTVLSYSFNSTYRVNKSDLEKELNLKLGKTSQLYIGITGIEIENGKLLLMYKDDTNGGYGEEITLDQLNILFNGMNVVNSYPDSIPDINDAVYIVPDNDTYLIQIGNVRSTARILSYNNGILKVESNGSVYTFNISDDLYTRLQEVWTGYDIPGSTFLGSTLGEFYYFNEANSTITIIGENGSKTIGTVESIDDTVPETVKMTVNINGISVSYVINEETDKELCDNLKKLKGFKVRPTASTQTAREVAVKQFTKLGKIPFKDDLLDSDPNAWAFKYAGKIGTLYQWNELTHKFESNSQLNLLFKLSQSAAWRNAGYSTSDVFNNLSTLKLTDTVLQITVNDETVYFEYNVDRKHKTTFKQITPNSSTIYDQYKVFVNQIKDQKLVDAFTTVLRNRYDPNVDANAASAVISQAASVNPELIAKFWEFYEELSDDEICEL